MKSSEEALAQSSSSSDLSSGTTRGRSFRPVPKIRPPPSSSPPPVLQIGMRLDCLWRDGTFRRAKIAKRRQIRMGTPGDYEYFVHYIDFDRRLDEWVRLERFDVDTLQTGVHEECEELDEKEKFNAEVLQEHEECTKVKNITTIELGKYEIDTWYFSPFPCECEGCEKLYFCEFCLNFMMTRNQLWRHMEKKCKLKHPPGDEIYRDGPLSLFEVDGKRNRVYGKNLCLLAKLFLNHKNAYCDIQLFLFYILCECDDQGCHMVGYFSKEKLSDCYNLSCILIFPPYQRKGYGKFLIAFSYELSKIEGKYGTPERPISDLGVQSYKWYWTKVLMRSIRKLNKSDICIRELADMTAMRPEDILNMLQQLKIIQFNMNGLQTICTDPKVLDFHLEKAGGSHEELQVDIRKLIWTPRVYGKEG